MDFSLASEEKALLTSEVSCSDLIREGVSLKQESVVQLEVHFHAAECLFQTAPHLRNLRVLVGRQFA